MWHASVSYHGAFKVSDRIREEKAHQVLSGVGDRFLGQWTDSSPTAFHLRRRLSGDEAIGWETRDIRLTEEATRRFRAIPPSIRQFIPRYVLDEEISA